MSTKPALKNEDRREAIDLMLWTGELLLHGGAQSMRIERTLQLLARALRVHSVDVLVLSDGLVITTGGAGGFRSRVRRVASLGVNLGLVDSIEALTRRVEAGELDASGLNRELERVNQASLAYSRFWVLFGVGLACAAFSRLFGGDWPTFGVTLLSSSVAMFVRQEMNLRRFNVFLVVTATALVAGLLPCFAQLANLLPHPEVALASSVLLLVPGVHLINSARDILRGYLVTGTARGMLGLVTTFCIALGLLIALKTSGVRADDALASPQGPAWSIIAQDAFWSGIAATGFAVLFSVPRRMLWACYLSGSAGYAVRAMLSLSGVTLVPATFLGAIVIGTLSTLLTRQLRTAVGVVAVPAAIPMVPGVLAFRSMIALIALTAPGAQPEPLPVLLVDAVRNFTTTWLVLAALAVGIALPSLLAQRDKPVA